MWASGRPVPASKLEDGMERRGVFNAEAAAFWEQWQQSRSALQKSLARRLEEQELLVASVLKNKTPSPRLVRSCTQEMGQLSSPQAPSPLARAATFVLPEEPAGVEAPSGHPVELSGDLARPASSHQSLISPTPSLLNSPVPSQVSPSSRSRALSEPVTDKVLFSQCETLPLPDGSRRMKALSFGDNDEGEQHLKPAMSPAWSVQNSDMDSGQAPSTLPGQPTETEVTINDDAMSFSPYQSVVSSTGTADPPVMRVWHGGVLSPGGESWVKEHLNGLKLQRAVDALEWWQSLKEPERESFLYYIIRSQYFDVLTAIVIFVNSLLTATTVDWEVSHVGEKPGYWIMIMEFTFISYYFVEIVLKLAVHRQYFFCNEDMAWNWFDLLVLVFAIFDQITTQFLSISGSNVTYARSFRIFKMGKILRMFRLIQVLRDLRTMMESIVGSFVSLFWSFVMLGLILYVFALIFVQGIASHMATAKFDPDNEEVMMRFFGSVGDGVLTLYEVTTSGLDWEQVYTVVELLGTAHTALFIFYIAFWNMAVVNILTGIFVDNAMRIAAPDRDTQILEQRRRDQEDGKELKRILEEELGTENKGSISKDLFAEKVQEPHLQRYLASLGLEVKDVDLFFDTLAAASGDTEMSIDEFVALAIRMKGLASSIDVQGLAFQLRVVRNQLDMVKKILTTSASFSRPTTSGSRPVLRSCATVSNLDPGRRPFGL